MPIPANACSCRTKTEYFPYIQSNYGDQMQIKRERSQLLVFATWSYQFGKPRAKAQFRSVHLFSSPLMCVLINEIISSMKLAPPSPELGPTSNSDLPPL